MELFREKSNLTSLFIIMLSTSSYNQIVTISLLQIQLLRKEHKFKYLVLFYPKYIKRLF